MGCEDTGPVWLHQALETLSVLLRDFITSLSRCINILTGFDTSVKLLVTEDGGYRGQVWWLQSFIMESSNKYFPERSASHTMKTTLHARLLKESRHISWPPLTVHSSSPCYLLVLLDRPSVDIAWPQTHCHSVVFPACTLAGDYHCSLLENWQRVKGRTQVLKLNMVSKASTCHLQKDVPPLSWELGLAGWVGYSAS